jgi:hypothetical protein
MANPGRADLPSQTRGDTDDVPMICRGNAFALILLTTPL